MGHYYYIHAVDADGDSINIAEAKYDFPAILYPLFTNVVREHDAVTADIVAGYANFKKMYDFVEAHKQVFKHPELFSAYKEKIFTLLDKFEIGTQFETVVLHGGDVFSMSAEDENEFVQCENELVSLINEKNREIFTAIENNDIKTFLKINFSNKYTNLGGMKTYFEGFENDYGYMYFEDLNYADEDDQREYDDDDFEEVQVYEEGGKFGLRNTGGHIVVEPIYAYMGEVDIWDDQSLILVKDDAGRYGYINHSGDVVIPLDYIHADETDITLSYGSEEQPYYILVNEQHAYGVCNRQGEVVVPFEYDHILYAALECIEDCLVLIKQNDCYLTNSYGQRLFHCSLDDFFNNYSSPKSANFDADNIEIAHETAGIFLQNASRDLLKINPVFKQLKTDVNSPVNVHELVFEYCVQFNFSSCNILINNKGKYGIISHDFGVLVPFDYDGIHFIDFDEETGADSFCCYKDGIEEPTEISVNRNTHKVTDIT